MAAFFGYIAKKVEVGDPMTFDLENYVVILVTIAD